MSTSPVERTRADKVSGLAREHLALSASASLVALSVLHIMFVGKFQISTILALLSVADRTQVVVSTLTVVLVSFAAAFFVGAWHRVVPWFVKALDGTFGEQLVAVLLLSVISLGMIQLAISFWLVMAVVITVTEVARRRAKKRGILTESGQVKVGPEAASWITLTVALLVSAIVSTFLSMPWVPRENLGISNGRDVVAYVIGAQDLNTMLLVDGKVRWVKTSRITSRQICESPPGDHWFDRRIRIGAKYPKCHDE